MKCSCVRLASTTRRPTGMTRRATGTIRRPIGTTRRPAGMVGNYEMPVQHGLVLVRTEIMFYNFSPCVLLY